MFCHLNHPDRPIRVDLHAIFRQTGMGPDCTFYAFAIEISRLRNCRKIKTTKR